MELNDKAKKVFALKYSTKKTKVWKETCRDIADFIAEGERPYGKSDEQIKQIADKFYEYLYDLMFIPGGRIIANAGTGIKNLANCFVLGIEDSRTSIYDTLGDAAEVFAMGGGVGYSFSKLREEGADIQTTGGKASGPLSFMSLFDQTGEVIQQASRRGAQLGSLDVSHPDIEKFIHFKSQLNSRNTRLMDEYDRNLHLTNGGKIKATKYEKVLEKTLLDDQLTHFNISVLLRDDFMNAVMNDANWDLISPSTGKVVKTVKAKDILYQMAEQAWESGDPGQLQYHAINRDNMVKYIGDIKATNPCFTTDTLILTDNGYEQIGTLSKFNNYNLINAKGNIVTGKIKSTGIKKVYILNLSTNKKIKCTADHIFMTVENEEIKAIDSKGIQLKPYLHYPELDNYYTLLGFIQGDGQLSRLKSKNHLGIEINIGKNDKEIINLLDNHKYTMGKRTVYIQDIKEDLINMKFDNNILPHRIFPLKYINWDNNQKASFLRGCFSANGCINNYGRITYKATSKKFIEQLQNNLETQFGISSYITTNKSHPIKFENGTYIVKESYDLNISDFESKTQFFNKINFFQQYKIKTLEKILNETSPYVKSIKYFGEEEVFDFSLPEYHWGIIEGFLAHNCGEVPLLEGESCILASINLHQIYDKKTKQINYELLKNVTKTITRFLEDVTEITEAPLDYINKMTKNLRRLGVGVLGFADLLVELNIPYESEEAIELSKYLSWFINFHAWETSFELAKERGAFGYYNKEKADLFVIEKTLYFGIEKSNITLKELREIGVRNVACTSIAPTGSIAIIGGVNSAIEPFFALAYKRNITEGIGNVAKDHIYETNPALERKLQEYGYDKETTDKILEYSFNNGTLTGCELVSEELQKLFKTANEISWKTHVDIQAAWQEYFSNAISKTINIPENSTVQDIYDIYLYMWQVGLKGGTIYRNNSKSFQILEKPKKEQ